MNSYGPDYRTLYILQDKIIRILTGNLGNFYLTGGTALGRFYLNHRFSDDLDFFVHHDSHFLEETGRIFQYLKKHVILDETATLQSDEFVRLWIDEGLRMKIEFVNDTPGRWNETMLFNNFPVDNPANILANKIGAMLNREEAKDVFDIVCIAENFSFNWRNVFQQAMEKQLMNEPDVLKRLLSFPVEWLDSVQWLKSPVSAADFTKKLEFISDDFLMARDNSLGVGKTNITEAKPVKIS